MKKKIEGRQSRRRLALRKEIIRDLTPDQLARVAGGRGSDLCDEPQCTITN
jgi:hypothetical protein